MMKFLPLLMCLPLGMCISAWEEPARGIYPYSVSTLNGPATYIIGIKQRF